MFQKIFRKGGIATNKVILIGRLTKDPEGRFTQNNVAVCNFTLAVPKRFKKQGDNEKADFINCQAWDKTAELITTYIKKGNQLSVIGRIQTRSWGDNDGKRHYVTEVIVEEIYFVDSKKSDSQNNSQSSGFEPITNEDDLPF